MLRALPLRVLVGSAPRVGAIYLSGLTISQSAQMQREEGTESCAPLPVFLWGQIPGSTVGTVLAGLCGWLTGDKRTLSKGHSDLHGRDGKVSPSLPGK